MATEVLVGTRKGAVILRSDDGRTRWENSGLLMKGWLVTAFARDASGRSYAAVTHDVYGATVLASDDLEHWDQVESAPRYEKGLPGNKGHNRIIGAMDPMEQFEPEFRNIDQIWKLLCVGDRIYAGVSEAGVFRSDDRGKSWQVLRGLNEHPTRPDWVAGFGGLCAHSLLVDGQNPDRIWVGISSAGAFRSEDGGETFEPANEGVNSSGEGYCVHSIAHDPNDADRIFRQDHRGVYRTSDGGRTWECIENGLRESKLSDDHVCSFGFPIAIDPASSSVFIVPMESDNFRYPHAGELAVYRTRDGGESWQGLSEGLPRDCFANVLRGALAVDLCDPCGVFFGTTGGSVFGSVDCGDTWKRLAADLPSVLAVEAFEV